MKVIKCKNITQYLKLEERACQHLNIPNKHHTRYAPPPNSNHLDFPVTDMVLEVFKDEQITNVFKSEQQVDEKTLKRRRKKRRLRKRVINK